MQKSSRLYLPKMAVTACTLILVLVIILTVVLYFKTPTKACAVGFLRIEAFALTVQLVLNGIAFRSRSKIVVLSMLFVSTMILFSLLTSFFNFNMMCELYPVL